MMMLALRGAQTKTQTFSSSGTWIARSSKVDVATGYGARGQNATSSQNWIYENKTIYATRRSDGARIAVSTSRYLVRFTSQSAHCDPINNTPTDPDYSSNQTCYAYDGFFTVAGNPATAGAATTAFGKSFPGATGNVTPTPTTYANIDVSQGSSYPINVPLGGSLTITWTE
jgi:hypothetical protein